MRDWKYLVIGKAIFSSKNSQIATMSRTDYRKGPSAGRSNAGRRLMLKKEQLRRFRTCP
jgi:hypothetical protein